MGCTTGYIPYDGVQRVLTARMSDDLYAAVREDARLRGMSMNKWALHVMLDSLKKSPQNLFAPVAINDYSDRQEVTGELPDVKPTIQPKSPSIAGPAKEILG